MLSIKKFKAALAGDPGTKGPSRKTGGINLMFLYFSPLLISFSFFNFCQVFLIFFTVLLSPDLPAGQSQVLTRSRLFTRKEAFWHTVIAIYVPEKPSER